MVSNSREDSLSVIQLPQINAGNVEKLKSSPFFHVPWNYLIVHFSPQCQSIILSTTNINLSVFPKIVLLGMLRGIVPKEKT